MASPAHAGGLVHGRVINQRGCLHKWSPYGVNKRPWGDGVLLQREQPGRSTQQRQLCCGFFRNVYEMAKRLTAAKERGSRVQNRRWSRATPAVGRCCFRCEAPRAPQVRRQGTDRPCAKPSSSHPPPWRRRCEAHQSQGGAHQMWSFRAVSACTGKVSAVLAARCALLFSGGAQSNPARCCLPATVLCSEGERAVGWCETGMPG